MATKLLEPVPLLKVNALGRFAVYRGDELIEDATWKRRKAKSVFKLLLLAPDHKLAKERVFEWLWPGQDPVRASNNLHRTLFILHRVLQPNLNRKSTSDYILLKDGTLTLNSDYIAWVDVEEFEQLIQLGRQQGHNLTHYESARALYQGDFLPEDLYEDWAIQKRNSLHITHTKLLQRIARLYVQRSEYNKAISCLQDLLNLDHIDEEAQRELMRIYAQIGQRHKALQLYEQSREILYNRFEIEPSSETTILYQSILAARSQPASPSIENVPLLNLERKKKPLRRVPHSQNQIPLIGRYAEVIQLDGFLQRAKAGHGTVILISGEEGIGKTRLAEELVSRARGDGVRVLVGPAYKQEGQLPYGPFVEAIRGQLTDQSLALLSKRLGVLMIDLARLLPEVAEIGSSTITGLELELGQERQRLFDAITAALKAFAQDSPSLFFLDDLHAAGESSLQLLHYLARQIPNLPILFLCTVREEELQRGTSILRLCMELQNGQLAQRLELKRLNTSETDRLCVALLGRGDKLDPELSQALYRLTEGNPFFTQELAFALVDTDRVKLHDGIWRLREEQRPFVPADVHDIVGLRAGKLSPEAYRLAGIAAVIGREFTYDLLQATGQWKNATLLDLIDELLGTFIIEETDNGYQFRHNLVKQVLYNDLTANRRDWTHEQIAHALERLAGHQIDEQAPILAHHYERAGQYEAAFRYLVQAGDKARATYASREALEYYNHALELCHQQNMELMSDDTLTDLLDRRVQTYLTLSDFEAAIGGLGQLLEKHRESGNQSREGEALYQLGIAHYWAHRLPKAANYLDQALQLAESIHYSELHTKSLRLRDILNSTQGNMDQLAVSNLEVAVNDSHNAPAEEHWGGAMLAHLRSDFKAALYHAQACLELGESLSNTFLMLGGYFILGMSHASLGEYQLALERLLHALELSETTGDRFWRARLLNTTGWVYRELFQLEKAIEYDLASLELARAGEPRLTEAEGNALANLATDYLLLEDYDQARFYL